MLGPAGVGKSRLLREQTAKLTERPEQPALREGRCPAYGTGIAYWALGEIMRGQFEILDTDDSDIAWSKVQPWREACAGLWPGIAEATSLRIAGPHGETLLLWGWLQARLRRELELEHEPAGEVELVAVDGNEVPSSRAERLSSSDLLSDQLEIFSRDRIYEEAVRGLAAVPA